MYLSFYERNSEESRIGIIKIMKTFIILFAIIALAAVGFFIWNHASKEPTRPNTSTETTTSFTDGTYCYERNQAATPDAPYAVEENVRIIVSGTNVVGTKTGTQSGPDMSNGYEGTLAGIRQGNDMTVVFAYTVEGSQNKEQELYTWSEIGLTKHRYALVDKGNLLVPDMNGTLTNIEYELVTCN